MSNLVETRCYSSFEISKTHFENNSSDCRLFLFGSVVFRVFSFDFLYSGNSANLY